MTTFLEALQKYNENHDELTIVKAKKPTKKSDDIFAYLAKYNPNHDELGRFSSGDGGGTSEGDVKSGGTKDQGMGHDGPIHYRVGPPDNPEGFEPEHIALGSALGDKYDHTLDSLQPKVADAMAERATDLKEKFPEAWSKLDAVQVLKLPYKEDGILAETAGLGDHSTITLNASVFDPDKERELNTALFMAGQEHQIVDPTYGGVFTHEFGHVEAASNPSIWAHVVKDVTYAMNQPDGSSPPKLWLGESEYSKANPAEAFAEAFTETQTQPKSQWSAAAKYVNGLITNVSKALFTLDDSTESPHCIGLKLDGPPKSKTKTKKQDFLTELEKFNPNHDELGRFSSGDGGWATSSSPYGEEKVSSSAAEEIKSNSEKFKAGGGTVQKVTSEEAAKIKGDVDQLAAKVLTKEDEGTRKADGFTMTKFALSKEGSIVAYSDEQAVAGAIGFHRIDADQSDGQDHPRALYIDDLGSTGIVPGAGSALFRAALNVAANEGRAIVMFPTADAEGFWTKMGIEPGKYDVDDDSAWGLSSSQVRAMRAGLNK